MRDPSTAVVFAPKSPLRRLTFQLTAVSMSLLIAVIVVNALMTARDLISSVESSARDDATILAQVIARSGENFLFSNDYAGIEHLLLETAAFPDVARLLVVDPDGRPLSYVINDGAVPAIVFSTLTFTPPERAEVVVTRDDGMLNVWQPITNGVVLGWVNVHYRLSAVERAVNAVMTKALMSVAVAIFVCIVVLWWYLRRPLRALRESAVFAEHLGNESDAQLRTSAGIVEIDQLRHALNFASRELDARRQALLDSREHLNAIVTYAADGIVTIDTLGMIDSFNRAAERMFGYSASEAIGKNIKILMPEPFRSEHDVYIGRYISTGEKRIIDRRREVIAQRKDGSAFPLELAVSEIVIGARRLFVGVLRDMADRKRAEELSVRLGRILEYSSNEIYIVDAKTLRLTQVSRGALNNLGYGAGEMEQLTLSAIQSDVSAIRFDELTAPLRSTERDMVTYEATYQRKDRSVYPVEVRLQLSQTDDAAVYVAIVQDITERKESENQLHYLANFDTLTGLPNRTQLAKRMTYTMAEANRTGRYVAVMFVDLDRFKLINDTMGHEAGDELLKIVARRIVETMRPGDTVARYGGDEFVLLLANIAETRDIDKLVEKLLTRLAAPTRIAGRELYVTPSIGIAVYPTDAHNSEELLKHADAAMYHAKEQGRNGFKYFTSDLNTRASRRLSLETSLRHALERGEFVLYFQPQVNASNGVIVGAEALVRWRHPELGLVSPVEFIPLAEDTGLIVPLGQWVLENACMHAQTWRKAGFTALRVAVNISGRQLKRDVLFQSVTDALNKSSLPATALDLELTESLLMQNLDETSTLLNELANIGAKVSMDDFGTGYSSLSYLKRLPIQSIKIDRAFVRDISTDQDAASIVNTIIVMAHGLKMDVIAEGVETREQYEFLRDNGCGSIQGFFFSKPMSGDEFFSLLRNTNGRFTLAPPAVQKNNSM